VVNEKAIFLLCLPTLVLEHARNHEEMIAQLPNVASIPFFYDATSYYLQAFS
jgi:hypothetical protein